MSYHVLNLETGERINARGFSAAQNLARKIAVRKKVATVVYERQTNLSLGHEIVAFDNLGSMYDYATNIVYTRPDCPGIDKIPGYRQLCGRLLIEVDW
jgi:hypothetical protein